ncbi:HAD family hydrolase [Puniceicoccaceae bacterium K14]|nr:HAD family hydrolase [Puniceicoccaceae bacterium K14]
MKSSENPFHPIKAVAIDLDGTLLDHDLNISPENKAAVEELDSHGIHIILASGRHHTTMLPFAKQLPNVEWIVSGQGSFTANRDLSKILYNCYLAPEDASRIIDLGLENEYSVIVYSSTDIHSLSTGKWAEYYENLAGVSPQSTSKEEVLQMDILKVALVDTEERISTAMTLPTVVNWKHYCVRSLKNLLEFAGSGTSKANGLKPLLGHLGLQASELAAFGDAPNDIPMLQYAEHSVAMTHAWPETKVAAKHISPDGPQETSFSRAVAMLKSRTSSRSI